MIVNIIGYHCICQRMKKDENSPLKFNSLSDVHKAFGLYKPLHPLISLISENTERPENIKPDGPHVLNFYKISYRPKFAGKLKYGQDYYDFDEGGLLFAAPGQIVGGNNEDEVRNCSQHTLLIHPDFL